MKMKARSHHRAKHLVDSDLCGDVAKYSDGLKKTAKEMKPPCRQQPGQIVEPSEHKHRTRSV